MTKATDFHSRSGNDPSVPFIEVFRPLDHVADGIYEAGIGIARTAAAFGTAVHRRIRFNRTVSALSSLSDHTLRDIGIDRSQIVTVAWDLTRR